LPPRSIFIDNNHSHQSRHWNASAPTPPPWRRIWGYGAVHNGYVFGTLKLSRALQVAFGTLVIFWALLASAKTTGNVGIRMAAGYKRIFCGLSAGLARILNAFYGKVIMPLGPATQ
jgi:succinate-acetate transporter protein